MPDNTLSATSGHAMLIDDLLALQHKLEHATGSLAAKWRHFKILAKRQSDVFPLYSAFVTLITGDQDAASRFREYLEHRIAELPGEEASIGWQFHTWCWSIPVARVAMAYDWIADDPAMADFDHLRAADTLIDVMHSQVYPRVLARVPTGDNQIASMLLACGVVGYLFGVQRGRDPRAQRLYRVAMARGAEIAASAHPQFTGEGSRYMIGVNASVMGWWLAFLRWLGKPCDLHTWLGCQQAGRNAISPSGMTLPWDSGGNFRASNMSGLALLARCSEDVSPLALIDHFNMWHGIDTGAWGHEDRIWTLIWWPENAPEWPAAAVSEQDLFPGWMHPDIGGYMDHMATGLRIFQAWDVCTGSMIGGVSRLNTDPNSLSIETGGSPLLLDGIPSLECRSFEYEPAVVLSPEEREVLLHELNLHRTVLQTEVSLQDRIRIFAHGCVGGSNALILNDEPWYYPRKDVKGRGTLWVRLPGLQALSADCCEHYTPRYPVRRVERTSILIQNRYLLVLDHIDSREPLDVSWQIHVRPEQVSRTDAGAMVHTPEGPWLQVLPAQQSPITLETVEGYPKQPVGSSVRVSWKKNITTGTLATLLVPGDDEYLGDADGQWSGGFVEMDDSRPNVLPALAEETFITGQLDRVVEQLSDAPAEEWRLLRYRTRPREGADYLRIFVSNENAGLWWNGQCICPVTPQEEPAEWSRFIPFSLPLERSSVAEVIIVTRPESGRLQTDNGRWYRKRDPEQIAFHGNDGAWRITGPGTECTLLDSKSARAEGWRTDAQWIIAGSGGFVALIGCTEAAGPNVPEFRSGRPCHVVWDGYRWLSHLAVIPSPAEPAPAGPMPFDEIEDGPAVTVPNSPTERVADTLLTTDTGTLAERLHDDDWRVRRAAVERLGELGDPSVCAAIRASLKAELASELYPPATDEPSPLCLEDIGRDTGCKRFRVLQALIITLRQLKDSSALSLIRGILQDNRHFYPVYCSAVDFLAEMGTEEDMSLLERWLCYPEYHTNQRVHRAKKRLSGRLNMRR